jgi:signal transduction histidine kinase
MPQGGKLFLRTCDNENWVFLEVRDTGIGIRAKSRPSFTNHS